MSKVRRLAITLAVVVGGCVAYILTHWALIEIGQEVVVLHKRSAEGAVILSRLWIVDEGEVAWLHHGSGEEPWIRHLEVEAIVEIERDGETRRYRAFPDRGADPKVHRLLREKYGFADRLVRFWSGTDTETGLLTGRTCTTIPVRLEVL